MANDNHKSNRDALTTLAIRLREHSARIQQITLVQLQRDLIAAAQAVEDLAQRVETEDDE